MERVYRRTADIILLFHIFVVGLVLFGWMLPKHLFWMYQTTVILTFVFGALNKGTCILTEYEWKLRRKDGKGNYNNKLFIPYYIKKYWHVDISEKLWGILAGVLVVSSFLIQMYVIFLR
jgi:hypothetical protein